MYFRPAIEIIKEYGNFPKLSVMVGQLNQVFYESLIKEMQMTP